MQTFVLEFTLSDCSPQVWRKLSLPGRYTLGDLHQMLQVLFGWQNCHMHEFRIGGRRFTDPRTLDFEFQDDLFDHNVGLERSLKGESSFRYFYDFGDGWKISAKVLEVLDLERAVPECLDGALAGPPENCGGIPGFENLREVLKNPRHPDFEEMLEWTPPGYDPDHFDKEALNSQLAEKFADQPL